jgi:hypothetical protein
MSLFRDSLRPPPLASDEAVRRYLMAIQAQLEPDPLFKRRLRGVVVNHFVAAREGAAQNGRRASGMGRIGRACLYASVALALSVGGAMGASRGALPGELLYSVKLQVEELRVSILPAHLHDDLAVARLSARIDELGRLTAAGDWFHASSLASAISDGYDELVALGVTKGAADGMLAQRLEVLEGLLDRLPPQAEAAIQRAIDHAPGLNGTAPGRMQQRASSAGGGVPIDRSDRAGNRPTSAGHVDGESGADMVEPSAKASPTARPTPSPRPSAPPRTSHQSSDAAEAPVDDEDSTGD